MVRQGFVSLFSALPYVLSRLGRVYLAFVGDKAAFPPNCCLTEVTFKQFQAFFYTVLVVVKVGLLPKGCAAYVTPKRFQAFVDTSFVVVEVWSPPKRCFT